MAGGITTKKVANTFAGVLTLVWPRSSSTGMSQPFYRHPAPSYKF